MERNRYSPGSVKFALWFMEFRKAVQLLEQGRTFNELKEHSAKENIFGASTSARAVIIQSTITARIKRLDPSFYPLSWIVM